LFPVYAANVPQEDRKPAIVLDCRLCKSSGEIDETAMRRYERGRQLRRRRVENGLSLRRAADCLGVTPSHLSDAEQGIVELRVLCPERWMSRNA